NPNGHIMTTKRKDTIEQFRRKQRRAALPPKTHNRPPRSDILSDLPPLTAEEEVSVRAARDTYSTVKKPFESWMVIARGLQTLKDKAVQIGGKATFDRLREREGLGGKVDGHDILNKTRVSRLLSILDNLPAVETWRAERTPKQRYSWASPEAVFKHCPVFAKD